MNVSVDTGHDLTGQMLIAMPGMADPRFDHSVVLLCAHSGEGAMGLIVNKRMPALSLDDLLRQLEIASGAGSLGVGVYFGGPVESGRGFVLHSTDYPGTPGTMTINARFGMTATKDILADIARGQGPATALTALGYAGWGPGQLESELKQNAWLTVDGDEAIVFDADDTGKWARALRKLGIEPSMLSAGGGSA
jgi:putative transcriptional regulator